ncbi:hypothetical protein M0805_001836 [Coniferiporia weirii]|nr:hypothetical protein M0805_001836 [Coniferiporia weirii]
MAPGQVLSAVHRGRAFELRAMHLLRHLSMSLRRVGGKNDGGVDLIGWWWLPLRSASLTPALLGPHQGADAQGGDLENATTDSAGIPRRRVRVVAQCKAERKKLGPNYVRELEGVLHRQQHLHDTDAGRSAVSTVALLVSESAFTKATLLRAMSSTLPLLLLHLPRASPESEPEPGAEALDYFGSAVWNPALGGQQGVLADEIDLRWERSGSIGVRDRPSLWWCSNRLESWVPPSER